MLESKRVIFILSLFYTLGLTTAYSGNVVQGAVYDSAGNPAKGVLVMLKQYVLDPVTGTEELDIAYKAYSDDAGRVRFEDVVEGLYYAVGISLRKTYEPVANIHLSDYGDCAEIEIHEIGPVAVDLHVDLLGDEDVTDKVSAVSVVLMNVYDIYKITKSWNILMSNEKSHAVRNGRVIIPGVVPSRYKLYFRDHAAQTVGSVVVEVNEEEAEITESTIFREFDVEVTGPSRRPKAEGSLIRGSGQDTKTPPDRFLND